MLRRAPGFAVLAILTLGLGIGANAMVFSAIDAVLLQPLPFPDGDRLMRIRQRQEKSAETNIAPIRLEDWNRLNTTFAAISGYYIEDVSDTSGDFPERIRRAWVAPRFADVWGVAPVIGRSFIDAEHRAGGPSAVLVSDRYWRRRLAGDPSVLGRIVRTGSASFSIVGVMPASFLFPDRDVDLWVPVTMGQKIAQLRSATWFIGVGRLKPGVTLEEAQANLMAVQVGLAQEYPKTDATITVEIVPLKANTIGDIRSSLWLLFGAVSVLLLLACTNVAALLLSRASDRRQEMAIRLSLGATRRHVAAQMLTETAVLGFAGGAFGLLLASGAFVLFRHATIDLPRMDEIGLDLRILMYVCAASIAVTLLCGVLPAVRETRKDTGSALRESGRTQVSPAASAQWLLVGIQVTLSVALMAAAGLLVRSVDHLFRIDPGFDPSHVLTFRMSGSYAETAEYDRLIQRIDGTIDALRTVPGVESAATAIFLPGVPAERESTFQLVEAQNAADPPVVAESRFVSREYFQTLGIPLVEGQACERRSRDGARTVLVNRTFAARYLSRWASPVGLHLISGDAGARPNRIVGVVADARESGLDQEPGATVYSCFSAPNPIPAFLVRTRGNPLAVAASVRLKMKELEPARAVYDIAPLEERIGDAYRENRLLMILLVFFAVSALSLACVGLYATLSHVISVRRREVGLRLALGATRGQIVRQFLGQGLRVAAVASLCGLALSIAAGRAISGMLFGVSPADPATLWIVVALALLSTALAAAVPAARAALIQPFKALRED